MLDSLGKGEMEKDYVYMYRNRGLEKLLVKRHVRWTMNFSNLIKNETSDLT